MEKVTMNDLMAKLEDIASTVSVDVTKLKPDQPLNKQGLDSMDIVNILFEIEDAFGVTIPDEAFRSGKISNLDKILESINEGR